MSAADDIAFGTRVGSNNLLERVGILGDDRYPDPQPEKKKED